MGKRILAGVTFFTLVVAVGFCADLTMSPPPAQARNVVLQVSITDKTPTSSGAKLVSGTKQDCFMTATVATIPSEPPLPNAFTHCWISRLKVTVNGAVAFDQTYDEASSSPLQGKLQLRWTTTAFPNGSPVCIRFDATTHCERRQGAQVLEEEDLALGIENQFTTFNVGTLLATAEDIVNGQFFFDLTSLEATEALACETTFADHLSSINHAVLSFTGQGHTPQTPVLSQDLHETELKTNISGATVFCATTHGGVWWFRSSFDDSDPANGDDVLQPSDVAAVQRQTGFPPINLVLMFACKTSYQTTPLPAAFGISASAYSNQAYGGFGRTVDTKVAGIINGQYEREDGQIRLYPLSSYVNLLMSYLGEGDTIATAKNKAYLRFRPVERGYNQLNVQSVVPHNLIVSGDSGAKIFGLSTVNLPTSNFVDLPGIGRIYVLPGIPGPP